MCTYAYFWLQRILAELGLPIEPIGINGARTSAQHALSPPHQRHATPSLPTHGGSGSGGGSSGSGGRDSADAVAAMAGISAVTTLPAALHVPSWAEGLGSQGMTMC